MPDLDSKAYSEESLHNTATDVQGTILMTMVVVVMMRKALFLACEDFGVRFDNSFRTCALRLVYLFIYLFLMIF